MLGCASRIAFHCSSQRRLPMSVHTQGLAAHTVPKTMRAAAIDRSGGPEVLSIHSLPVPELDASEVLIAVDTAGVGAAARHWQTRLSRG
jgi:hypothetical protein